MSNRAYDLTNPQKSIWQTGEFYKGTSIENISGRATILEKVDFKKFEKAINLFIKKNHLFWAVLGLCCCVCFSLVAASRDHFLDCHVQASHRGGFSFMEHGL